MIKKNRAFIILILLLALCVGCDSSLEIRGLEIESYPDRIVYHAGIDNDLDLGGGKVTYLLKGGTKSVEEMGDQFITVTHEIDFTRPGVYVVQIERNGFKCKFPIQVIE